MIKSDIEDLESIYYQILCENTSLIQEMFVIGNIQDCYFIAYKDKIWKIDFTLKNTSDVVRKDIEKILNYRITGDEPNFMTVVYNISNENKGNDEILFGMMYQGKMTILDEYFNMIKDPQNSILFKKVYRELNPAEFGLQSGRLYVSKKDDLTKKRQISDTIFFHGTSSDKLHSIIKNGLDKNVINQNYPKILVSILKGKTFITSNFRYALNHAIKNAKMTGAYPVVISFKVRFEDLLQPDYDVRINTPDDQKALKVSREMGIYGYSGNISPWDFDTIYLSPKKAFNVDNYSSEDIIEMAANDVYHHMNVQQYSVDDLIEQYGSKE